MPRRPFIIRNNPEPYATGSSGVDLMLECKADPKVIFTGAAAVAWAPLSFMSFAWRDETLADLIKPLSVTKAASIIKKKGRFMAFVASYCYKDLLLDSFGQCSSMSSRSVTKSPTLSATVSLVCGGTVAIEYPKYLLRTHWEPDKPDGTKRAMRELVKVYSSYKFVITFENSRFDGYFTEKMISAVLAKAIPVYFGDPSITRWINPKAIVLCDVDTSGVQWDRIPQLSDLKGELYSQHSQKRRL